MLIHENPKQTLQGRVIIVGARSFLGAATMSHLRAAGVVVLGLTSDKLDLRDMSNAKRLGEMLRPNDSVIMFAALTPDKGHDINATVDNLRMAETLCAALDHQPCAHVIYFSSDAVYSMNDVIINEQSPTAPINLYGCMHLARELLFQSRVTCPLAILRPTMVYGAEDSHNAYGPNRFGREARETQKVTLKGKGEETRDHVYIDDIAKITFLCLRHRSSGVLNVATGKSISFFDLAFLIASISKKSVEVVCTERSTPITNRHFDITATKIAFPEFEFTSLKEGLERAQNA